MGKSLVIFSGIVAGVDAHGGEATAIEYGNSAIRVNAVCPGVIRTEIAVSLPGTLAVSL